MEIIIGGRRCGKTTKCLEWVDEAERVQGYPFWNRILLTVSQREADRLRQALRRRARARGERDSAGLIYNKVYCVEEWQRTRVGAEEVKVMIDNADLVLQDLIGRGNQELAGITWNLNAGEEGNQVTLLDDQGGSVIL